jgi:hypothetical protein
LAKATSHKLDRQQATSYCGIITERKNMIRIYELSLGQNAETDMTTILDHKTNTIIAEFDDYDMALYFLNKCFKLILKDMNRDGWLYTLKQAKGNRKENK